MFARKLGESVAWALFAWIVAIAMTMVPGGALGATVTGAIANGSTSINASICTVFLSATIPETINVASNDTVQTIYNVAWSDTRRANSSSVSSVFTVKVWYPSDSPTYESDSHTRVTTGAESGSTILAVYTEGVTEGTTMKVEFDVVVSGDWLGCGALNWDSGIIYLA